MIDSAGYYYMGLDTVGICFLKKKKKIKIEINKSKWVQNGFYGFL